MRGVTDKAMANAPESDERARLLSQWSDLVPQQPGGGAEIIARYADPARRYHTVAHLSAVLEGVRELSDVAMQPHLVALAAWFHDAVYDVRRDDNEEQSAALAMLKLGEAGLEAVDITEVARLVRLTATHAPAADDVNGAVLCDADLWVLAADGAGYDAYVRAVRAEYAHVGDDDFRRGRVAVVEQLLALPSLFRTPRGQDRWEQPARHNLEAELARLH